MSHYTHQSEWSDFLPKASGKAKKSILWKTEKKASLSIRERLIRTVMRRNPEFTRDRAVRYIDGSSSKERVHDPNDTINAAEETNRIRRNDMKSMFFAFVALFVGISPLSALSETVVYRLTMVLNVPRVYENTQSLGYRKNQTQKIVAYAYVDKSNLDGGEPRIEVYNCINKTHKVGGSYVTYKDVSAHDVMWRYIGSNKTGVFKNTNIGFSIDLDPSYNIGADEPDNTLVIMLSGSGNTEKSIKGAVAGRIGCGCMAYGHKSPTRTVDCRVSDIVPLSGTFTMKRVGTCK